VECVLFVNVLSRHEIQSPGWGRGEGDVNAQQYSIKAKVMIVSERDKCKETQTDERVGLIHSILTFYNIDV
jgi:hypothetical protein